MTSGSDQIRVACGRCGFVAIHALRIGDTRTLRELRGEVRCSHCHARARGGRLRVRVARRWKQPFQPPPSLLKPAITQPTPAFWVEEPATLGARVRNAAYRVTKDIAVALHVLREGAAFVFVCGALFGGMYLAAGTFGAAKSTYEAAMDTLATPVEDFAQVIANVCDARINWMTVNGPRGRQNRARIYSFLDQTCPDDRDVIESLRRTRPT